MEMYNDINTILSKNYISYKGLNYELNYHKCKFMSVTNNITQVSLEDVTMISWFILLNKLVFLQTGVLPIIFVLRHAVQNVAKSQLFEQLRTVNWPNN